MEMLEERVLDYDTMAPFTIPYLIDEYAHGVEDFWVDCASKALTSLSTGPRYPLNRKFCSKGIHMIILSMMNILLVVNGRFSCL